MRHIEEIKRLYVEDERVFSIGYSGGKDSSVVLNEVLLALLRLKKEGYSLQKPVYVLFSDTGLEMEPVIQSVHASLERLEKFAKREGLPIEVLRIRPKVRESFWSLLIGKGYVLPRSDSRWCTDRLKIKPSLRAIQNILKRHRGFIAFIGVRKDESPQRAKRIEEKKSKEGIVAKGDYPNSLVVMPIKE